MFQMLQYYGNIIYGNIMLGKHCLVVSSCRISWYGHIYDRIGNIL